MTTLEIKTMAPKVLSKVVELSSASPLGHTLRANIAHELGLSFNDALDILEYLRWTGDVTIGRTINDNWVKPNLQ